MEYKKEFIQLVELVKKNAKAEGVRLRNEDIATRMDKTRTYLSDLLSTPGKQVTKKHIDDFKLRFAEELKRVFKPSAPADKLNRERAMLKAYRLRIAKLEAIVYNKSLEECLNDLDRDTKTFQDDLENV
jgi:organic radical activating enzyme